jgi:hypothetical protein
VPSHAARASPVRFFELAAATPGEMQSASADSASDPKRRKKRVGGVRRIGRSGASGTGIEAQGAFRGVLNKNFCF